METRDRARQPLEPAAAGAAVPGPASLQQVAATVAQGRYARRGVSLSNDTIRVMLVDDHTILRDGLRGLLRSEPDMAVVAEASNGVDAVAIAARCAPDVVVMDLDMPGGDGATATRELSRLQRPPRVLILSMHSEEERLVPLLQDGASGFLSKDAADRELVDAIRVVASGEVFVRPTVARLLAANARPRPRPSLVEDASAKFRQLSGRERSVLCYVAEGYSGVEIGRMLGVTPKTIDTYKNRIGQKLGFTHRTEYVRFALRVGLIGLEGGAKIDDATSSPLERSRPSLTP